jgi:hypothetical protein
MKSRVRISVQPWRFFLEGEDPNGDHGLGSLVEFRLRPLLLLHIHISPSTSSGQRNCASWASHPQKSVTLRPQPGGQTTKSIRDMWWYWKKKLRNLELLFKLGSVVPVRAGVRPDEMQALLRVSILLCGRWQQMYMYPVRGLTLL